MDVMGTIDAIVVVFEQIYRKFVLEEEICPIFDLSRIFIHGWLNHQLVNMF